MDVNKAKPSMYTIAGTELVQYFPCCSKCKGRFSSDVVPRLLGCNHTFCEACLVGAAQSGRINCFECGYPTTVKDVKQLRRNYAVELSLEDSDQITCSSYLEILEHISCKCPVCFEPYTGLRHIPRIIPCGHTFCEDCLRRVSEKIEQGTFVECPTCQNKSFLTPNGVVGLDENDVLVSLSLTLQRKFPPHDQDGIPQHPVRRYSFPGSNSAAAKSRNQMRPISPTPDAKPVRSRVPNIVTPFAAKDDSRRALSARTPTIVSPVAANGIVSGRFRTSPTPPGVIGLNILGCMEARRSPATSTTPSPRVSTSYFATTPVSAPARYAEAKGGFYNPSSSSSPSFSSSTSLTTSSSSSSSSNAPVLPTFVHNPPPLVYDNSFTQMFSQHAIETSTYVTRGTTAPLYATPPLSFQGIPRYGNPLTN